MSDRDLPRHPNIAQYKKQAKDLIKSRTAGEPEALERIGNHHPRLQGLPHVEIQCTPFKLSDAQLTMYERLEQLSEASESFFFPVSLERRILFGRDYRLGERSE